MRLFNDIKKYCEDCISGKIISCTKHKWACQRFLDEAQKIENDDFPYFWNEEEAERIVKWFRYLRHSKGVLAGKPIELTDWQKFRICQLYGWRKKENGLKRFRKSFTEVARKNAKSQEEAGIALYELATQSTKNKEIYEIYTAGVKRDQSRIITTEAALMLKGSLLENKFKISYSQGKANSIIHIKTGSTMTALSKEDGRSGDGSNPAVLILDEYHQHPNTDFYGLFMGANTKEGLLMIITTAGYDLNYPCYTEEYNYCSKILNPDIDTVVNDEYMVDICEIDEGDDIDDRENWKKANPIRMSYKKGIENIESEYKVAKETPEKMPAFLTKCLNKWVQKKENGYMDMSKWKRCEVDKIEADLNGMEVYVGFDMSAKIDLTSVAFVIPFLKNDKNNYYVFSHSFIPNRDRLMEHIYKDKVRFDAWEAQGYITVTDSEIVDQQQVIDYVIGFCKSKGLKIKTLCFDPHNASKMMTDLDKAGYEVEEVWQSHKVLNDATCGLRDDIYDGNIVYEKNPVLDFAMANTVTVISSGNIKIDKAKSIKRIDPVDALICAYRLAMFHNFKSINTEEYVKSFLNMF